MQNRWQTLGLKWSALNNPQCLVPNWSSEKSCTFSLFLTLLPELYVKTVLTETFTKSHLIAATCLLLLRPVNLIHFRIAGREVMKHQIQWAEAFLWERHYKLSTWAAERQTLRQNWRLWQKYRMILEHYKDTLVIDFQEKNHLDPWWTSVCDTAWPLQYPFVFQLHTEFSIRSVVLCLFHGACAGRTLVQL